MKKVEEILIQYIEDIKAGKASLEDCLGRYPEMRHELEPLLKIALSIEEPADIRPSDVFKVRAKVNLMEHIHASQSMKRAVISTSQASVKHGWYTGWARAVAIVVAAILAMIILDEFLTIYGLLGGILIVLAVIMINYKPKKGKL